MYRLKYLSNPKAKGFIAAFTAIAALFLGGCSEEEKPGSLPPHEEGVVMFDAYLSGVTQSRAPVVNVEKLKQSSFGVLAYDTDQNAYNPDNTGGHTPNFMYNQQVEWVSVAGSDEGGKWTYSPEANWSGNNISFFAYAPYTSTFGKEYGVTALTGKEVAGDPKLTFKVANKVSNQTDLLYAKAIDCMEGAVQFDFKHALSRISFRLPKFQVDDNTRISVNGVTIQSSDFAVSGSLNLHTGIWEDLTKQEGTEYSLTANDFVVKDDALLTGSENYLMIIPNGETNIEITVSYKVITEDKNLTGGQSEFTNEVTKLVTIDFQAGKAYDITLNITLTSVTFDAEISDWDKSIDKELDSSKDSNSK